MGGLPPCQLTFLPNLYHVPIANHGIGCTCSASAAVSTLSPPKSRSSITCTFERILPVHVSWHYLLLSEKYNANHVSRVWLSFGAIATSSPVQKAKPRALVRCASAGRGTPPLTIGPASLDVMGKALVEERGGGNTVDYFGAIELNPFPSSTTAIRMFCSDS
jgi:hypothetical protein